MNEQNLLTWYLGAEQLFRAQVTIVELLFANSSPLLLLSLLFSAGFDGGGSLTSPRHFGHVHFFSTLADFAVLEEDAALLTTDVSVESIVLRDLFFLYPTPPPLRLFCAVDEADEVEEDDTTGIAENGISGTMGAVTAANFLILFIRLRPGLPGFPGGNPLTTLQ
jgi:hypothetical protein